MRVFLPAPETFKADLGFWAALGSSCLWGTLPLYWYLLRDVSPPLILCHRILWSCVFLLPLVIATGRFGELVKAARNPKVMRGLCCSSLLLGCNWLLFIWAVNNGRVLETSLGYYINPLMTIAMGIALFGDKPGAVRLAAISIAVAGVTAQIVMTGAFPWVGLGLASLFSVYALLRKLALVESLPGLALETAVLAPLALAYVLWTGATSPLPAWGANMAESLLLAGTGVITSVPLILYAYGARHLPFTTLGILQYISPSCSLLLGVFVFEEPLTPALMVAFAAIWTALTLYTADSLRKRGKNSAQTPS